MGKVGLFVLASYNLREIIDHIDERKDDDEVPSDSQLVRNLLGLCSAWERLKK